jgi:hypothetical protein
VNENDSVRISTLATLVDVTILPNHCLPGRKSVSFIQNARMRGGACGVCTRGVGQERGATTTADGSTFRPELAEQPVRNNAVASTNFDATFRVSLQPRRITAV